MNGRLRWVLPALCLALAVLAGCSIEKMGNSLGSGFTRGVRDRSEQDSTRWALKRLADSASIVISGAIRRDLGPALDVAVNGALRNSRALLLSTTDSLRGQLRGPVRRDLDGTISSAVGTFAERTRDELRPTLDSLRTNIDQSISPALARALGAAADTFTVHMAYGMRTRITDAADTIVARSVGAATRKTQTSDLWVELRRTVTIAGIMLLVIVAAWLWNDRQKAQRALEAMAGVVNQPGHEVLKPQIKVAAMDKNVEGWLHTFLEKKKLL